MATAAEKTRRPARRRPAPDDDASTRERMLDAALSAFSELGYDGASTREIAKRAHVNQGLIPYYFGSKEKLWQEAVHRAFAEVRDRLDAAMATLDGDASDREAIERLIRGFARFAADHPEFHRLMTEEGKRDGPRLRWIVDHHVKPIFESIQKLARRASEDSPLALRLDPALLHYLLIGATTHLYHQAPEFERLTGRRATDPDVVEAHADALVALFLGPDPEAKQP
jgi:AcrR family transcriptional regulator